jgi:lipoyl(octanoyl) transferase
MAIAVVNLGAVGYADAEALQRELVARRRAGEIGDVLLLLEHPPVVTLGRNAKAQHVLASAEELRRQGVELAVCDRGGDVTYHGPGQLVGYPILDLRQLGMGPVAYMRALEEVHIRVAAGFGLEATRQPGMTGVWIAGPPARKLVAMGIHVSRGVTSHGFALNVAPDLGLFTRLIVPCGLAGQGVTSLRQELGRPVEMARVRAAVAWQFGCVLGRATAEVSSLQALRGRQGEPGARGGATAHHDTVA